MIGGSCICKHPPRAYYTSTYSIVLSRMVICSALNLLNLCCLLSTLPRRGHTTNQLPVNIPGTGAIKSHSNKQNKSCTALFRIRCCLTSRMLYCSQNICNCMLTWIQYHAMASYSSSWFANPVWSGIPCRVTPSVRLVKSLSSCKSRQSPACFPCCPLTKLKQNPQPHFYTYTRDIKIP